MKKIKFKMVWTNDVYEGIHETEYYKNFWRLHRRVLELILKNNIYFEKYPLYGLNHEKVRELEHHAKNITRQIEYEGRKMKDPAALEALKKNIEDYCDVARCLARPDVASGSVAEGIDIEIVRSPWAKSPIRSRKDSFADGNIKIEYYSAFYKHDINDNIWRTFGYEDSHTKGRAFIQIDIPSAFNAGYATIYGDEKAEVNGIGMPLSILLVYHINMGMLVRRVYIKMGDEDVIKYYTYEEKIDDIENEMDLSSIMSIRVLKIYNELKYAFVYPLSEYNNNGKKCVIFTKIYSSKHKDNTVDQLALRYSLVGETKDDLTFVKEREVYI